MVPAVILASAVVGLADAAYAAIAAVVVALIGLVGTVSVAVITTNRDAKRKATDISTAAQKGDDALQAVSGVGLAVEVVREELARAHARIDRVEEREAQCLETVTEQTHEILRLRSMVVAMGASPDLGDL